MIIRRCEKGFSMIEVLIALLIIGIGVLGFMGMQNYALQSNIGIENRSRISMMAAELVDRMTLDANPATNAFCTGDNFKNWVEEKNDEVDSVIVFTDSATTGTRLSCPSNAPMQLIIVWRDTDSLNTSSNASHQRQLAMDIQL